jgi:hypothetical protein
MKRCTIPVLMLFLIAAGCGQDVSRPRVQGKVTFQGKPVGGRTLTLWSEGAAGEFFTQRLALRADGSFSGEVPVAGNYKVVIEESMAVQEGSKPVDPDRITIPEKYKTAATSDLVWHIRNGANDRDLELKE